MALPISSVFSGKSSPPYLKQGRTKTKETRDTKTTFPLEANIAAHLIQLILFSWIYPHEKTYSDSNIWIYPNFDLLIKRDIHENEHFY